MARPVARGRAQGLSRLTAPVHSAWFWPALWVVAAAASFAALIPDLFPEGAPVPGYETIHTLSGVSFTACGLIAWRRRPDSAVGRLLTAAGFGVLIGPILEQFESPAALTLEALIGELWIMRVRRTDPELRDRRPARDDGSTASSSGRSSSVCSSCSSRCCCSSTSPTTCCSCGPTPRSRTR